jgi:HSP20 family protein
VGDVTVDIEKLKQWMELAQNMHGGEFWNNIFDQEFANQFLNDKPVNKNTASGPEGQTATRKREEAPNYPPIEIVEGAQEVYIIIELPGVKKEDMELGLTGNQLTIKGTAATFYPHLKRTCSERFSGEFQRQISLPDAVPPNKLTARFWNGLLFVSYKRSFTKVEISD